MFETMALPQRPGSLCRIAVTVLRLTRYALALDDRLRESAFQRLAACTGVEPVLVISRLCTDSAQVCVMLILRIENRLTITLQESRMITHTLCPKLSEIC